MPELNKSVFLNIPYDRNFESLFLAYTAGLVSFGLIPRPSLAVENGKGRLHKILTLIEECPYSVHDLSRIQLSKASRLPRFNMPLELGIALHRSYKEPTKHNVLIFEEKAYRLQQSTSDLNAYDAHIHQGSETTLLKRIRDAFQRESQKRTIPEMLRLLEELKQRLPALMESAGAESAFDGAGICNDIIAAAVLISEDQKLFQA